MSKSDDTKRAILKQALDLSSEVGLEGLTLGMLAKKVGMSKSGLYAHFDSKEDLQCKVLDTAAERFTDYILSQVITQPRGLPRIRKLFELWLNWIADQWSGGCPFIAAATEFDDRPGPVRDQLVVILRNPLAFVKRAAQMAIEENHFRKDLDVEQFAFDFWSIVMAYHHYARLLRREDAHSRADKAFNTLIQDAENT